MNLIKDLNVIPSKYFSGWRRAHVKVPFKRWLDFIIKSKSLSLLLGGGFRDSLADIAEELCPSSSETPVPLPFFIRSPNQVCNLHTCLLNVNNFPKGNQPHTVTSLSLVLTGGLSRLPQITPITIAPIKFLHSGKLKLGYVLTSRYC